MDEVSCDIVAADSDLSDDTWEQVRKLEWPCQACGRTVAEKYDNGKDVKKRSAELWELEKKSKLVCGVCDGIVPVCKQCGACCSFFKTIEVADNPPWIRWTHLWEFDGMSGYLKQMRKPWSNGHPVCLFLKQGQGCKFHGVGVQPLVCHRFNCERSPFSDRDDFAKFREFKKKWIESGMDRSARGDDNGIQK